MRKLLLLTFHFPPQAASGTFRILGFSRYLPQNGWKPIVVAPPSLPWEPRDEGLLKQVSTDTILCSAPYPNNRWFKVARHFFINSIWLPKALTVCRRAIERYQPEALLTSSPPHCLHVLGLYLKRRYGLPWVADFRDPWFIDGLPGFGPMIWPRFEKWCERAVMRHADAIIANAPGARDQLCQAFPQHREKIVVVTNGFDAENFSRLPRTAVSSGPLRVVYAGEVYAGRDPRAFLNALQDIRASSATHPEFQVSFLGRAQDNDFDLTNEIHQRGLSDLVDFRGQVPYEQIIRVMGAADILLLLDSPKRRIGVPAKLYEYMGAGRPILALTEPDNDVAWALRASGLPYRIAPVLDSSLIKNALLELAAEIRGSQRAGINPLIARFTRAKLVEDLAAVLTKRVEKIVGIAASNALALSNASAD